MSAFRPTPFGASVIATLAARLFVLLALAGLARPAAIADENAARQESGSITALVNARVITVATAGTIDRGTVVIQAGKIQAVGHDVTIPEGAEVIDLAGATVTPGLIDLRSTLWMSLGTSNDAGSTAALDARDAVDPFDTNWQEVAAAGVTAVYIQPYSSGTLGGYGALLRATDARGIVDSIVVSPRAGFQASLGVGTYNQSSRNRLSEYEAMKKRFSDAKSYGEAWQKYREFEAAEAKKKEAKEAKEGANKSAKPEDAKADTAKPADTGNPGDGKADDVKTDESKPQEPPKKPAFDPLKERLLEVLSGKLPVRMEVHRADDIRRALELAKEFSLTLVLEGLSEPGSSMSMLKDTNLPLVLGPWLESEKREYQSSKRLSIWAKQFAAYPGQLAIATFSNSARGSTDLRAHAAAALAAGLEYDRVMRAVTTVPATIAGAGTRLGKIEVGYEADLSVFAGDPLDPASPVKLQFIAGKKFVPANLPRLHASPNSNSNPSSSSTSLATWEDRPQSLPSNYAIRSQHVLQEDGTWQPGAVQISDGQIVAVHGADFVAEELALFDIGNAYLTPGLVSAHAELASALWNDRQEFADAGTVRAADVYDPRSSEARRMVAGGFLRAGHSPAKSRVMAGQMSELRLGTMQGVINAELAELVVLSSEARSRERFPASLAGQIQLVNAAWAGTADAIPLFLPAAALSVFEKEQKVRREQITRGERRVVFHAESDAETTAALKLADTWKLAGAILAPDQLQPIIPQLVAAKIAVIARPSRGGDYHWYAGDLVLASEAGVPVGVSGSDPLLIRQTVAEAVRAGLPEAAAMQWLTNGSARVAGMSAGAGSLVAGTQADLVVWSGSPVHLAAKPLAIIVDGKFVEEK